MTDATDGSDGVATDLVGALEPARIRARRRPTFVLLVWGWELACGLLIATPLHAWAARAWGAHPDGDAAFFRPGGHALLSWLGDDGPALAVVTKTSLVAWMISVVVGQLVTGGLVAALATGVGQEGRAPPLPFALRAGAVAFVPLLSIGVITGAIQAFVVGVGIFVSAALDRGLEANLGDARSFTVRLVALTFFALAALILGVVADLARVSLARAVAIDGRVVPASRRIRDALATAFSVARRGIGRAVLAWGSRAAVGLGLLYVGSLAGDAAGERGGGALWLLFLGHQLVIVGRVGLRASWLASALRLVSSRTEPST